MKKCQFCGAELPEKSSFCLKCSSVINTREVFEPNNKKEFSVYKKAVTVSLLIIFTFSLCFLSSASIKALPTVSDEPSEPQTTLIPATLQNGEEVTDDLGNTVYDSVTVEPTAKKPSILSEIISSITGKDDDKGDNNISEDTTDISNSDISKAHSSAEQDCDSSVESSSEDNNTTSPSPTESTAPTESTTEEETDVYEDPSEVFEYENYNKSGTQISITKYKGDASFVTVPDYIDGKMVVQIGENAFQDNSKIKTIDIPKGNRRFLWLREACFNNLSSLLTVNLYDNDLGTSGDFAVDCPIKTINITYWQYKFVDGVLYQNNSREWEVSYFAGNPCYTTLTVQPWCTRIDTGNLDTATNLKVINAHKDVTYIPGFVWCYNKNLEAINIEEGNSNYFSKDGVLFSDYNGTGDYTCIYPYSKKDKSFAFPQKDEYTFKLDYIFMGATNPYLEEIYIPLGTRFNNCPTISDSFPNLKKIHFAKNHQDYKYVSSQFTGEITFY